MSYQFQYPFSFCRLLSIQVLEKERSIDDRKLRVYFPFLYIFLFVRSFSKNEGYNL